MEKFSRFDRDNQVTGFRQKTVWGEQARTSCETGTTLFLSGFSTMSEARLRGIDTSLAKFAACPMAPLGLLHLHDSSQKTVLNVSRGTPDLSNGTWASLNVLENCFGFLTGLGGSMSVPCLLFHHFNLDLLSLSLPPSLPLHIMWDKFSLKQTRLTRLL